MTRRALLPLLPLLVLCAYVAVAQTQVTVPSDVSGPMWWSFEASNPTLLVLDVNLPGPAPNASDNLRIGLITQVKQAGGQYEVLTLRFKINGILAVGSPRYGVPDQEVAQWSNGVPVKVLIIDDTIEVYIGDTRVWSCTASEKIPDINYIYADSATFGQPAFDGGGGITITVDTKSLNTILVNKQMQESISAVSRLFTTMMPIVFMIVLMGFMTRVLSRIANALR